MASVCFKRLQKELVAIQKSPVEHISTTPNENNLLEWHYVIEGPPGSVYEGGYYHGALRFPKEYPYKPPSILMFTRNGRFKQNIRLCLSMSDYHPESWNPMWSVASILSGLMSFMLDSQSTLGSMEASDEVRRQYARQSLTENLKNTTFRKLFPQYVILAEEKAQAASRQRDSSIVEPPIDGYNGDTLEDNEPVAADDLNAAAEELGDQRPNAARRRTPWAKVAVAVATAMVAAIAIVWGLLTTKATAAADAAPHQ